MKINRQMIKKLGIYVHIPFCISKCKYCGFYSHLPKSDGEIDEYIKGLSEDIGEYAKVYGNKYEVDSVFIGGGTPSAIDETKIGHILEDIGIGFSLSQDCEITIESNPKTLNLSKLKAYKEMGINRLSMGVQSFDDDILRSLGRVHGKDDVFENYTMAREAGFENINIDLMFGVPGHSLESWKETLDTAIMLNPEHISFYSLQLEEGTPFYQMYKNGEIDLVSENEDRQMYHYSIERFRSAGYELYEISNCAKKGYRCRHNMKYWSFQEYLGIGSDASSFLEGCRFKEGPSPQYHVNTFADSVGEYSFTALRTNRGIVFEDFKATFGKDFKDVFEGAVSEIEYYNDMGLLVADDVGIRLTEAGIDVSNKIMAVFV